MLARENSKRSASTRNWPTYGGYTLPSSKHVRKANSTAGKSSEVLLLGYTFHMTCSDRIPPRCRPEWLPEEEIRLQGTHATHRLSHPIADSRSSSTYTSSVGTSISDISKRSTSSPRPSTRKSRSDTSPLPYSYTRSTNCYTWSLTASGRTCWTTMSSTTVWRCMRLRTLVERSWERH